MKSPHSYYKNYTKREHRKVVDNNVSHRLNNLLDSSLLAQNTKTFLESLAVYHEQFQGLTSRQYGALERIEEHYETLSTQAHEEWVKQYGPEHRRIARICSLYYQATPPYFAQLIDLILNDPDFIPTERQYRSLCENKYAKKIIEATEAECAFQVGALVEGRATAPPHIAGKVFSVITAGELPVVSAAKGAKVYTVLPMSGGKILECEERYLKRSKKS